MTPAALLLAPFLAFQSPPAADPITAADAVVWNPVLVNANGIPNPAPLAGSEVAVSLLSEDLNTTGSPTARIPGADPTGAAGTPLAPLLSGLPPGEYYLWIRVRYSTGPWSAYSAPYRVQLLPPPLTVGPAAPTGLRKK